MLPPDYYTALDDGTHPVIVTLPNGTPVGCEDEQQAHDLAWRLYAESLAECPDPCPPPLVRALCDAVGSQREAARRIHVDQRTMRKWAGAERSPPWAAMELLRRMAQQA